MQEAKALSDEDWKVRLTEDEYAILRCQGTERAHSHPFAQPGNFDGYFCCKGCSLALFEGVRQFESYCGWPSFDDELPVFSFI